MLRYATVILFALFCISLFVPEENLSGKFSLWLFILSSICAMVLVGLTISRPVVYRDPPGTRVPTLVNPEELLEMARRLWYSEKDAVGAEQILDEIMRNYPDSPEAEKAKAFRFMLARSPARATSDFRSASDTREGCRQAIFRVLAGLLGVGFLAMVAPDHNSIEPAWLFMLGKIIVVVFALFFLDVAITGGLGLFALAVFINKRDSARWSKYVGYVLGVGAFITLVVINDQRDALRAGRSYQLIESFFYVGTIIVVSAVSYFLFLRKK